MNATERAKALVAYLGIEANWETGAIAGQTLERVAAMFQEAENAGRSQRLEVAEDLRLFDAEEWGLLMDTLPISADNKDFEFIEGIRQKLNMANATPSYYMVPLTRAALMLRQINNLQHAGIPIDAGLWSDAFQTTEKALGRLPVNIIEAARSDEA